MKTVISAKLKLNTTPEQFAQLRAIQLAYRDALNFVSKYAFEHGKMSNKVSLQDGTYDDLTDIRECTPRRKRDKKGRRVSRKQRKANATYSKWSFAELHSMLAYKAQLAGSMAIKVDAHYTSKACPMCGHTCDANRPGNGPLFICQKCHYTLHADLVGARNVTMRTLLVRQDWMSTGTLSECPDVADCEAKAARLKRYAELRWSLATSPCL
jgi:predicted transposase